MYLFLKYLKRVNLYAIKGKVMSEDIEEEKEEEKQEEEEAREDKDKEKKKDGKSAAGVIWSLIKKIFIGLFLVVKFIIGNRILSVVLLILLAVGATILFARQKPEFLGIPTSQEAVDSQKEISDILKKVSELMVLPEGEIPTIATVTDAEKIRNQPFLMKAENGDKVIVYSNAKKAILYRPSIDKIVEVGNVGLSKEDIKQETAGEAVTVTPQMRITPTQAPEE